MSLVRDTRVYSIGNFYTCHPSCWLHSSLTFYVLWTRLHYKYLCSVAWFLLALCFTVGSYKTEHAIVVIVAGTHPDKIFSTLLMHCCCCCCCIYVGYKAFLILLLFELPLGIHNTLLLSVVALQRQTVPWLTLISCQCVCRDIAMFRE